MWTSACLWLRFKGILDEALSSAGQLRDPYLQAAVLNTLAVNRIRVFRYDEALVFGVQALRFAEECRAERLRASALGNLGLCSARLGDFDKAHAYSEQAADLRENDRKAARRKFGYKKNSLTVIDLALNRNDEFRFDFGRAFFQKHYFIFR